MVANKVRDFSKRGDAIPVPTLTEVQADAYRRFLQADKPRENRNGKLGLEALLREVFPIESYDGTIRLEYLCYDLDEPRYTPDECRELRLTYGMPFRIRVRPTSRQAPGVGRPPSARRREKTPKKWKNRHCLDVKGQLPCSVWHTFGCSGTPRILYLRLLTESTTGLRTSTCSACRPSR